MIQTFEYIPTIFLVFAVTKIVYADVSPTNTNKAPDPHRDPGPCTTKKRPPRARRPTLPQPCAAVLSAMAGLTSGFGMGPGDPRLHGRARGGRSPAARMSRPAARSAPPWRLHSARHERPRSPDIQASKMMRIGRRARAISTARLRRSHALHLRPIDLVVYKGPYRKEDSSWRRLPT